MEFFNSQSINLEAILKFNDITPNTQSHLRKVYAALLSGIVIFGTTTTLNATGTTTINPTLSLFVLFATLIFDIAAICMSNKGISQKLKAGSFYLYASFLGFLFGSSFVLLEKDEAVFLGKITITAGLYAAGIFTIFSLFSLLTVRRTSILLYSVFGSLFLSLLSLFFISSNFIEALIGLAIGILYVVVDTQMIIYKTEIGKFDVFGDAKELFIGKI